MITGYRRYQIYKRDLPSWDTDSVVLLRGAAAAIWHEREMAAECNALHHKRSDEQAVLAAENHLLHDFCPAKPGCGIYVAKRPDMGFNYKQYPVVAAVTAWGAYIEYEMGWRVQYARIEHLWIEPDKVSTADIKELEKRYEVQVSIRDKAICCGEDHPMVYWPSKEGPKPLCEMATSHIVNSLRFLKKSETKSRANQVWVWTLEQELKRRAPQGTKVRF